MSLRITKSKVYFIGMLVGIGVIAPVTVQSAFALEDNNKVTDTVVGLEPIAGASPEFLVQLNTEDVEGMAEGISPEFLVQSEGMAE